ncbi:MAG: NADH-quinone oxidoreductase subunit C [Longimonas sp.]|uniref:NADH-quinone oxidoreductase subunit C n=1 Tax=Longimonas sp. TaxID=2039626 RepID=UPI00334EF214
MPDNDSTSSPDPEVLNFHYTPADAAISGSEENPHAKATTHCPDTLNALVDAFGEDAIGPVETYANEDTVYVPKSRIADVCRFLREEQGFAYLADLGGIDRFTQEDRFEVFYNVVNMEAQKRLRVKIRVDEDDLHVPTVTSVYRSANWNEREAYDMLGLIFDGHPDLRRMYMPEDFEYYPLRKEFPQLGVPGSLPLPPQAPDGELTMDPFAAAHGSKPVKSYEEPPVEDND